MARSLASRIKSGQSLQCGVGAKLRGALVPLPRLRNIRRRPDCAETLHHNRIESRAECKSRLGAAGLVAALFALTSLFGLNLPITR